MISMARILGAPESVPAGKQARKASTAASPAELALERADQVHDVGVALDEHQVLHLDGAEFADAADVVAAEVDEHECSARSFSSARIGFEARSSASSAERGRVPAMGRYSTSRCLDADEKFGRRADDMGELGLAAFLCFRRPGFCRPKRRKYM